MIDKVLECNIAGLDGQNLRLGEEFEECEKVGTWTGADINGPRTRILDKFGHQLRQSHGLAEVSGVD